MKYILISLSFIMGISLVSAHDTSSTYNGVERGGYIIGEDDGMMEGDGYSFSIITDLIRPTKTDTNGIEWYRGFMTEKQEVKVKYESDDPRIESVSVAIINGNVFFMDGDKPNGATQAILEGSTNIDIVRLDKGAEVILKVPVPGRNTLSYVVKDENDSVLYKKNTVFDAFYDDGNWEVCGQAELSSPVLASQGKYPHWFNSGIMGFGNCPLIYPYYSGEAWNVPLEYHSKLNLYRIVNPLTSNPQFKDYTPEDVEIVDSALNAKYSPEAFLFDWDHPAWWILHAEDKDDAYCEATNIGMMALHIYDGPDFTSRRYNEKSGVCRYVQSPQQNVADGVYLDEPGNLNKCIVIVKFSGWAALKEIESDEDDAEEYYTLDGYPVENPSHGIYICRKGSKVSKVIL